MISVIVPIYNVEKYLKKSVDSILNQDFNDYEILLIDDGSTDQSSIICDEYAKKYEKIRVFHKENGGLSDARNFGVIQAKGEYVSFVDSDDYVSFDYLSTLYQLKKTYNADIVITGIQTFFEDQIINIDTQKKYDVFEYTGKEALKNMLYQKNLDTSACAMLLPVKLAKDYMFPKGKFHEDELTTYKYYSNVSKVIVTTKKQYFYLQRKGSIMHVFGQSSMDEIEAADNLVCFCQKNYPDLVCAAESKKFSDYCQVLLSNYKLKNDYNEIYIKIVKYLKEKKKQILLDKNTRMKNKIAALILFFGIKPLFIVNKLKK